MKKATERSVSTYRDFEIDVRREKALGGWCCLYYTVTNDSEGITIADSFSESEDTLKDFIEDMKNLVDDFYINPQDYK